MLSVRTIGIVTLFLNEVGILPYLCSMTFSLFDGSRCYYLSHIELAKNSF